jgi:hypothetical protein
MNVNPARIPQHQKKWAARVLTPAVLTAFDDEEFLTGFEEWLRRGGADKYSQESIDPPPAEIA